MHPDNKYNKRMNVVHFQFEIVENETYIHLAVQHQHTADYREFSKYE